MLSVSKFQQETKGFNYIDLNYVDIHGGKKNFLFAILFYFSFGKVFSSLEDSATFLCYKTAAPPPTLSISSGAKLRIDTFHLRVD